MKVRLENFSPGIVGKKISFGNFQLEGNFLRSIFLAGMGVFFTLMEILMEGISVREGILYEREPDIPALFKNNQQLNKKQVFSTESKKEHHNLKRTEITVYVMRVAPYFNTSLFTLKSDSSF